ncbi:MAG: acyl carrier protein [Planctomycetes bacterium]|nr:acyl carrier protein [Planctomycetota bacterium]
MSRENLDKFNNAVSAILGVAADEVVDSLSSESVDSWDSLNHINLIGALEQEFGVMLPTESIASFQSVAGLKSLLADHGVEL